MQKRRFVVCEKLRPPFCVIPHGSRHADSHLGVGLNRTRSDHIAGFGRRNGHGCRKGTKAFLFKRKHFPWKVAGLPTQWEKSVWPVSIVGNEQFFENGRRNGDDVAMGSQCFCQIHVGVSFIYTRHDWQHDVKNLPSR